MASLNRFILRYNPVPDNRMQLPVQGPIWIIGGDSQSISNELKQRGTLVDVVNWDVKPSMPSILGGIIFAVGNQSLDEFPFKAFTWLRAAHDALRKNRGIVRLVTTEEISPVAQAIAGLVKTARHEWPEVSCRTIKVNNGVGVDAIADELLCDGPIETVMSQDRILTPHLVLTQQPAMGIPLEIEPGALVVVTGGARGVTAEAALALAQTYRPTMMLLGRSPPPQPEPSWLSGLEKEAAIKRELFSRSPQRQTPQQINAEYRRIVANREIRETLNRLSEAGSVAHYQSVDVRDRDAVRAIIDHARRRHGPVCGIIHGSGVLADRRIVDKSDDNFRSVFDTKVVGCQSLLAATADDPLRFIVLFSSSTGRFGRSGQCDYAAANEYLNATAHRLRQERRDCRAVAINWGPWDGGMVTPSLHKVFADEGVGLIPTDDGGKFLVSELSALDEAAEVVALGPPPNSPTTFSLSADRVPPLSDHMLAGKMILPIALAIEYMAEAAVRRVPDHRFVGCNNLCVLNAVHVPADQSIDIEVECDDVELTQTEAIISVRLLSNGRACFRADVVIAPSPMMDRYGTSSSPTVPADCYDDELFHGRAWQGISAITSCDSLCISATAQAAPPARDWALDGSLRNWHADPLLIDCALQSLIVYSQRVHCLASLPTKIGRLRLHERINPGPHQIRVRITESKSPLIRGDVTIIDATGSTAMTLEQCEHICAESLRSAFRLIQPGAGSVR